MDGNPKFSRRGFVGGVATALGYLTLDPSSRLWAQSVARSDASPSRSIIDEYDSLAKLANNENPYGPSEAVMKAMTQSFKYANRYGYPDGGITQAVAKHHGVKEENVMLGSGSGEILDVACNTYLREGRKILSSEPSYDVIFQHVTAYKATSIKVPSLPDFRQDIPGLIKAARAYSRDIGFVYICSPNNPTGRIVTKQEIKQLLDGIPEDMPVLIDEAYFHFVEDPDYETSIPHVFENRPVMVTRTFSKVAALAGMRLGYVIAPTEMIRDMRPYATGTINAIVKWGGVAALSDIETQAKVKRATLDLRRKTATELQSLGYSVVPSEANFIFVHVRRPVPSVIDEFKKRGILVGRPFPPFMEHLRVSIGTADEMSRFMTAFREILGQTRTAKAG
ncbi:MAG: pyridoxal phosphate-dependent aminotransferase [Gemmatimonadaceae bacterium]